ncbi:hypothetical protein B0A50_03608 [Salinomyces thailandicus]|uniref:Uncharacterized protein n=1 Tax=Salinomyces thailandicus TaxID=706561 RepID=A0A4U0U447_9PEZI|nr:hypothetical protein B0A50_03608 [Salinomyces thailandica]
MAPYVILNAGPGTDAMRLQQGLYLRNAAGQSASDPVRGAQGSQAQAAADGSAANSTTYLGIGLGVGGAIIIAIVLVAVKLLRKRAEHRKAVSELEDNSEPVRVPERQDVGEVPRPASVARCGSFVPLQGRAGWGALSSDETIHEPKLVTNSDRRKRSSVSVSKRIKHRGIPLKRLKHLSAIIESPRSRGAKSPMPAGRVTTGSPTKFTSEDKKPNFRKTITLVHPAERDEDVFAAPGSPKPHVLPSFAIRSPGMYGAAIANDDKPKPPRSVSVGALTGTIPANAVSQAARPPRPQLHARSISLGAPPSLPPSGPVPPIPAMSRRRKLTGKGYRQGVCISRVSSSSQESASSSVLVTSPILTLRANGHQKAVSPSLEQLTAEDEDAELKAVVNRQWQNPCITGPRPMDVPRADSDTEPMPENHASIHSNVAHYSSNDSLADRRLSSASTSSTKSGRNRLSIPHIGTADSVSISRVSSISSLHGRNGGGVQTISTPRRRQSSVSANGSPTERRKPSTLVPETVLREIQPNAVTNSATPSRQASTATHASSRSSNGNPFQWDQNMALVKPSALKGSPTSKGSKGHKRQNCVRISTLTPQVLGPPPSRPTTPGFMDGIEEEGDENSSASQQRQYNATGMRFVGHPQRLSKAPSDSSLTRNLKVRMFRASLTPSSPTLSTWTAYQEHQGASLPSQHSDSQLSISPVARTASRQSDRSSAFSIPSFPSPSKATVSDIQRSQPVPEFCLSRPSTDEPSPSDTWRMNSSPPFLLHLSPDKELGPGKDGEIIPSSPPAGRRKEYDPAWPVFTIPAPEDRTEYDPASPPVCTETAAALPQAQSSSPASFPFAVNTGLPGPWSDDDRAVSPLSRPTSYGGELPDTPPISPKTISADFTPFFDSGLPEPTSTLRQTGRPTRSTERLTSANASTMMATIPEIPPKVGFPTAVPILSPPSEYIYSPQGISETARRQRAVPNVRPFQQSPPAPSTDRLNTQSPIPDKHSPQGPRSEPAKSVLKNAMALRRMNSEIDVSARSSRRYTRLTREPSPLLPWIGSPEASESCHNGFEGEMFDFDFGGLDAGSGAASQNDDECRRPKSALDDIDMTALDRRLDDK